jgi:hypothetical protein
MGVTRGKLFARPTNGQFMDVGLASVVMCRRLSRRPGVPYPLAHGFAQPCRVG